MDDMGEGNIIKYPQKNLITEKVNIIKCLSCGKCEAEQNGIFPLLD